MLFYVYICSVLVYPPWKTKSPAGVWGKILSTGILAAKEQLEIN